MTTSTTAGAAGHRVTGFLGQQRSTLMRHLLLNSGLRLAVDRHDSVKWAIDGACCAACGSAQKMRPKTGWWSSPTVASVATVQDDFLPTIADPAASPTALTGTVVETSGLALLSPWSQGLLLGRRPPTRTLVNVWWRWWIGEAWPWAAVVAIPRIERNDR